MVIEIKKIMETNPKGVRFADLCNICYQYFEDSRQEGPSNCVYKTPWKGDPRVNIQNDKGNAKAYQVKQVLRLIERLEYENSKK